MKRLTVVGIFIICQVLLSGRVVNADSWPGPQETVVHSSNGVYHVRIVPGKSFGDSVGFAGAEKGAYAQAIINGTGAKDERTFVLLNPVAPVEAVLLDNGSLITFDNWHNLGYGKVVVLYDKTGKIKWSYELETLISKELIRLVTHSVSSRWWRKSPLEWTLERTKRGEAILLTLWNEDKLRIQLSDGKVEYVPIADLGNDPQRLFRRARALSSLENSLLSANAQESYKLAVATFRQAIALEPTLVDAYRELAITYRDHQDYSNAITTLQDGIQKNPIIASEEVTSESGWQRNPKMWLRLELAWVYEQAGQLQESEVALRECLKLDPWFWEAGQTLVRLLFKTQRKTEADTLLAKFFELKKSKKQGGSFYDNLSGASYDIGSVYEEQGDHRTAKNYYLKAYESEVMHDLLYRHLAIVCEKLGEYNQAQQALEKLHEKILKQQQESKNERLSQNYQKQLRQLEKDIARLHNLEKKAEMVGTVSAYEPPLGQPSKGLQASIKTSRRTYKVNEPLEIVLVVTNVSDHPILIDPWPGNWFVRVFNDDDQWKVVLPVVRAIDVIRELPKPLTLGPGEKRETRLEGLRLIEGLPGSTPLWEYDPLKPGKYYLGAVYAAMKYPDHPNLWTGGINCTLVEIEVTSGQ